MVSRGEDNESGRVGEGGGGGGGEKVEERGERRFIGGACVSE
jgi:hypothetical protein